MPPKPRREKTPAAQTAEVSSANPLKAIKRTNKMDSINQALDALSLVIGDVTISQDDEGRYSLNDLQRAAVAAGVTKDIRPNEWLSMAQPREMVEVLIAENSVIKPGNSVIKPAHKVSGRYGGTYVVKEIVYSYAMWVDQTFHLKVVRAYDALMQTGGPCARKRVPWDRAIGRIESIAMKLDRVKTPYARAMLLSAAEQAMFAVGLPMPDDALLLPMEGNLPTQLTFDMEGGAA